MYKSGEENYMIVFAKETLNGLREAYKVARDEGNREEMQNIVEKGKKYKLALDVMEKAIAYKRREEDVEFDKNVEEVFGQDPDDPTP